MPQPDKVAQFATRLHAMKLKSNRSYEALARRIGASSSALHRYCRGVTVPSSYDIVAMFARACGATDEESTELLRSWTLATGPGEQAIAPAPVRHQPIRRHRFVFVTLVLAVLAYVARRRPVSPCCSGAGRSPG